MPNAAPPEPPTSVPLRLSVLDQSPIAEGTTGAEALHNTLDLARTADRLGYHRYWLAEHHGTPALASASPEALIGPVAAATARLRVGSGGVMLPHYSPFKVAETFSVLGGLFPGRIDLGIGRAAGTDPHTTLALQRDRRIAAPDDFREHLAELLAYLRDGMPEDHPFARLADLPGRPGTAEPWLLGSSPQSGIWAAELGLPYVFADFINAAGAEVAARYRDDFRPSPALREPRVAVAAWVVCAETDEEAERLASSAKMMFSLLRRGRLIAVPPPETAIRWLAERDRDRTPRPPSLPMPKRRAITGSPSAVREGVEALAEEYGAEEVMLVNILYDHAARRRSYELVADAFGLSADGA